MVTAGVGMHLRQKHPPHMSILEKRGLMSVPCFSHEKNPPAIFFAHSMTDHDAL
jgi:hypothetical protein